MKISIHDKMPADNERFGARGAVARRKGITNLKVITPQNFYCQPPLRQAAALLSASVESVVEKVLRLEREVHFESVVKKNLREQ